ncbi:gluconokinase [Sphingomonas sp. CGMCC 1.13654]|uniref:Gluconokinase n=2 Tax=Sphingomonas chungangi TaxID=2683589 RepID=A0A838L7A7_9SPHN|nr:gluconokinase [Sphingomonas chungangi]MBA2934917.1 gluconokinase [Sphingomonas chungangi]MVW58228.1 AAA family ATPase [Sphingomonas chungangi]
MGVSGSGKSTVAMVLARRLGIPFCEGDDLHPPANVAKMRAGQPLDDTDRAPWLAALNDWMHAHRDGGVVSCSALRRRYRDRLRQGLEPPPAFVLLDPPRAVLERRMAARREHFMPASLLDSQLATLELPEADEHALRLEGDGPAGAMVKTTLDWLAIG